MLSKRPKPYSDDVPAPKRLAANVRNLYASNLVSCRRTQSLINDMDSANVEHLPAPVNPNLDDSNLARTLRKRMNRHTKWPTPYFRKVRVLNRHTGEEEWQDVAIQLPLEIVDMIHRHGDAAKINSTENMDPLSKEHYDRCTAAAGGAELTGVGLHCDGVPHSWDREESAEVFSVSLPGLPAPWSNLRIPCFSLPHSAFGENTWDDVMEPIAWSFRHMWQGTRPQCRDDGSPWLPTDAARKRMGERSPNLTWRGCLVEIRGDWKMFAETFHLERWNGNGGICWSCECTVEQAFRVSIQNPPSCGGAPSRRIRVREEETLLLSRRTTPLARNPLPADPARDHASPPQCLNALSRWPRQEKTHLISAVV